MTNLVALYRGSNLSDAHLVAVSSDPAIVGDLAARLLRSGPRDQDPAISAIHEGRRKALRIVKRESDGS